MPDRFTPDIRILRAGIKALVVKNGPQYRAALLTAFLIESYLALALPAIIVGFAIAAIGLETAPEIYGTTIIVMAVLSTLAQYVQSGQKRNATTCPRAPS